MAPHRLTVRLDDDNAAWVDERADKTGRSKAWVVNEAISAARGDDRTALHRDGAHRTDADRTTTDERLDDLEARIAALEEDESPPNAQNGSDSSESGSNGERMNPLADTAPAAGSDGGDAETVRARVREFFGDRDRMDRGTIDAVASVVAFLAEYDGPVRTKELKEHADSEIGDEYSSVRSMWNSIDRYVEEVPGVEKSRIREVEIRRFRSTSTAPNYSGGGFSKPRAIRSGGAPRTPKRGGMKWKRWRTWPSGSRNPPFAKRS